MHEHYLWLSVNYTEGKLAKRDFWHLSKRKLNEKSSHLPLCKYWLKCQKDALFNWLQCLFHNAKLMSIKVKWMANKSSHIIGWNDRVKNWKFWHEIPIKSWKKMLSIKKSALSHIMHYNKARDMELKFFYNLWTTKK